MSLENIAITIDELKSVDLAEVVKKCKEITYYELESAFREMPESNATRLLSATCSMCLRAENSKSPFTPKFVFENRRGLIESDFSKSSLEALADYSQLVDLPELKARLSDLCWVTKVGDVTHAYSAIDAYLDSASQLLNDGVSWPVVLERVERALRLSCLFRRQNQKPEYFHKVSALISENVERRKKIDKPYFALRLLRLAAECDVNDPEWRLLASEEIGLSCFIAKDYSASVDAWEICLDSARQLKDKEKETSIWREISKCHISEADIQQSGLIAAGCLLKAIDALSKVQGTRQERLELYEAMREHQIESLHQLHEVSTPVQDISKIVNRAIMQSQGKDLFDSLFRLAVIVNKPTNIQNLKAHAKEQMQSSFAWMFGATHIDHDGMTTAVVPSGLGVDSEEHSAQLWAIMMRNMSIDHQLAVAGQISPSISELTTRFHVTEGELLPLLKGHPFIPNRHEHFFSKGIVAGFQGDFLVATHLMIPQIENSLRYLVRLKGEEPTTLHGDGSQERNGLKYMLEHPAVIDILGVDIAGNLQAILVDKIYGDLRNQISHGYSPADSYFGATPVYVWWLILHILLVPFSKQWSANYGSESATINEMQADA